MNEKQPHKFSYKILICCWEVNKMWQGITFISWTLHVNAVDCRLCYNYY